ncbi:TonB-dependent siderophore receptor [Pseudothauera rhizosphaerae]|uniref:TonB-dependent siderophore receptor n=2 Tax=Pseudothauera rhizosphaerae TaxID=2565932 RepID=A0A4S4A8N1_9RHOO|nr:TonB-dependent siderophore receptor [Pseudothauera rhizosphaerae]
MAAVAAVQPGAPLHAQEAEGRHYDIPAGGLTEVLKRFGVESGLLLSFSTELTAGLHSPGLQGRYSTASALRELLGRSGLEAVPQAGGYLLRRAAAPAGGETRLAPVTVTAQTGGESAWGPVEGYAAKRSATGTKTDTPIIETPQSISVVTADYAEAIGATTLKEALSYTPSINIAPYGTDSRYDWIYLRGFDGYASTYLDGLPLRNTGSLSVWRTENYNLERFEVLRGPSSVLYGQNSPGGVINVVSKRPTDKPLRELQVQVGEDSRKQVAGDFSGPVDGDGKLLYRLTALVKDAEFPAGDMADDRHFIAPSLTWRPSGDTSLTLLSHFMRDRGGVYTRVAPQAGTLLPNPNGRIPSSNYLSEPDFNQFDQDQWMLGYILEHRPGDTWTLRQNARYSHMEVDYWQAATGRFVQVDAGDPDNPANFRRRYLTVNGTRSDDSSFVIDNQAEGRLEFGGSEHTLLIGLDHQQTRFDEASYYSVTASSIDIYRPTYGTRLAIPDPYADSDIKLRQTGLYLQDQIKFGGHWVATLGGRYDWAKVENHDRLGNAESRQTDEQFTGRAGLVYLAPNGLAPYVSYAESFVPNVATDPLTGKPFDPETGRQYEIGLRYQPPGRGDSYSVAAFDLRRRNYITYDAYYVPKQRGEVTVRGLEFEAQIQPVRRMNLVLSYSLTPKAEVTRSSNPDEIGKQANPVSRHQASAWADYRFAGGFKAGLGARYVGSNRGYNEATPRKVPAYTVFDAMIGYDFARWSLALNARNVTDKTYYSQCGYGLCYFGDERKVFATAAYRW